MLNRIARLYLWACHRLYNEFAWTYDSVSWLVSLGHWWGWRKEVEHGEQSVRTQGIIAEKPT